MQRKLQDGYFQEPSPLFRVLPSNAVHPINVAQVLPKRPTSAPSARRPGNSRRIQGEQTLEKSDWREKNALQDGLILVTPAKEHQSLVGERTSGFIQSGNHNRMQGCSTSSIRDYRRAVHVNPRDFKSTFNLAASYENLGLFQKAVKGYLSAIKLNPKNPHSFANLGTCYLEMQEYSVAIRSLSRAIHLNSKDTRYYQNRAIAFRHCNRFMEAAMDYATIQKLEQAQYISDLPTSRKTSARKSKIDPGLRFQSATSLHTRRVSTATLSNSIVYKTARTSQELRSEEELDTVMDCTVHFPFFQQLSAKLHFECCRHLRGVSVPPGTLLFTHGDPGGYLYFVQRGKVTVDMTPIGIPETTSATSLEKYMTENETYEGEIPWRTLTVQSIPAVTSLTLRHNLTANNEFGKQGYFSKSLRTYQAFTNEPTELFILKWSQVRQVYEKQLSSTLSKVIRFYSTVPLFKNIPPDDLERLARLSYSTTVESGQQLLKEGQRLKGILIIRTGRCRILKTSYDKTVKNSSDEMQAFVLKEHLDNPFQFIETNRNFTNEISSDRPTSAQAQKVLRPRDTFGMAWIGKTNTAPKSENIYHVGNDIVADRMSTVMFLKKSDLLQHTSFDTRQFIRYNYRQLLITRRKSMAKGGQHFVT